MSYVYILIIVSQVHGGQSVHTRSFNSLKACESAKEWVIDKDSSWGKIYAECHREFK